MNNNIAELKQLMSELEDGINTMKKFYDEESIHNKKMIYYCDEVINIIDDLLRKRGARL